MKIALSKQASKQASKREYWLTDYGKLIAAFLVVAIHTEIVVNVGGLLKSLLLTAESCAVPVFFCVTGYLLQERAQNGNLQEICKKWFRKYVKLYVVLSLVYLPLTFYGMYADFEKHGNLLKIFLKLIKNYLLVGEQFYSWPLWYLLSVMLGLALLAILPVSKDWLKLVLSCVVFTGACFISEYSSAYLVRATIGTGRLFTGLSYLLLGVLTYKWKHIFQSSFGWVIPSILWGLFSCWGVTYSTTSAFAFISTPWIVGHMMKYTADGACPVENWCRKISTWVYYSHMYFLFIWMYVLPVQEKGIGAFLFTGIMSLFFSLLFILSRRKKKSYDE